MLVFGLHFTSKHMATYMLAQFVLIRRVGAPFSHTHICDDGGQ